MTDPLSGLILRRAPMKITKAVSLHLRVPCPACGHRFEVQVAQAHAPSETRCPQCQAPVALPTGAVDRAVSEALAQARLPGGAAPLASPGKARSLALAGNLAGGAAALWTLFLPRPYPVALAASIAVPHGLMLLVWLSGGAVRLTDAGARKARFPNVVFGFFAPLLALALRGLLDFQLERFGPLLVPTLAVAGVELLLACLAAREFRQKPILTLVVAPFLLAFAFGGCIEANCLFDRSAPRAFQLRVLDKRISTSRHSSTCYLRVPPWGPRGTDNDLTVGRRLYGSLQAGDPITLRLRKGFLGAAWYTVGRAAP